MLVPEGRQRGTFGSFLVAAGPCRVGADIEG